MSEIFSLEAPKYWVHDIPVMPLHVMSKRPFLMQWQQFCRDMPTLETQQTWLERCKNNNIGLPLGPQSNIMIVDIDTTDQRIYDAIINVLPKSPWMRVGAKGCALAYKFNGEKGFKIISDKEGMVVEVLSIGNQLVLPPSIHPDTKEPYKANCNLYDVLDELVVLPSGIEEVLRATVSGFIKLKTNKKGSFKTSDFVAEGSRDIQMVHYSGLLAYEILKGEKTFKDAIGQMMAWCDARVAKINGDEIDHTKGCRKIVEFMMYDIANRGKILPPGWDLGLTPEERIFWNLEITEDQEEWNLQQTLDYINSQFTAAEASDPKRTEAVKYVLKKMAKSQKLDEIDKGKILTTLKEQSGLGLTMGHFNKELKKLTQGPIDGDNHSQIAQEIINVFKERDKELRYFEDKLWIFNGTHWEVISDRDIKKMISDDYGNMAAAKKNQDHKGILEVIKTTVPQELSKNPPDGINFLNGFLTRDLNLVPHAAEHGMTYVMNFCYKPEEADKCPLFMDYLHYNWGQEPDYASRLEMLREAMAATLFGVAPSLQKVFLLYGAGNNGKSVMLEIIDSLVPQDAKCAIPPTEWGKDFVLSNFAGKLLNYAGELANNKSIQGDLFKNLVVGEPKDVRAIYGKTFTLKSKCAHWFATNDLPKTTDGSKGFNRRWNIFSFNRTIEPSKIIPNYGKIIVEEEVEGIVAWAVGALPSLLKRGTYTYCESSEKLVNQMAFKNNPMRQWVQDFLVEDEDTKVLLTDLYSNYWAYCIAGNTGGKPPSKPDFVVLLEKIMRENNKYTLIKENNLEYLGNFSLKRGK